VIPAVVISGGNAPRVATQWKDVAFGDVARNCTASVKDPGAAGIERYVGLEHLEPGSLQISRWGDVAEGTTFTRLFKSGDVLFGKRRAYQRKAAVAPFRGVCSGDILVFEAAGDQILPAFLPFVVQSDGFFRHALGTSAGSLSPRTKWKDLARYEFSLPPVERQAEVVALLEAANLHVDRLATATAAADLALRVLVDGYFRDVDKKDLVQLGSITEVRSGLTVNAKRRALDTTAPYLRVGNVGGGTVDLSEVKEIGATEQDVRRYGLRPGDVLVVEGHANADEVGRSAMWDGSIEPCLHQNHLFCVRSGEAVKPAYIAYALSSAPSRAYFRTRAKSTSGLHTINSTVVRELRLRRSPADQQDAFLDDAGKLAACSQAALAALEGARDLARSLRERLLEPPR
jgi:restriction endonuclease S subunit